MKELKHARQVLDIVKELSSGVDTTRTRILEEAGRARTLQLKADLKARREKGALSQLSEKEAQLQVDIITSLDQMCRRMPFPLPDNEIARVKNFIEELDTVRGTRDTLPVSPGLSIWRGCLHIRRHDYPRASEEFHRAVEILRPMVDESPVAPPTIISALCEGAYSLAMQGMEKESIAYSDEAISVARTHQIEEAIMHRILREQFVAGEHVTLPLATAYLTACDVRINLHDEWNPESQLASHVDVYWNLLNDECGGLSALEVPFLIAILSDERWMGRRPDLAAPIARALYLKTSSTIPQALWRRANLFLGGFRFSDSLNGIANSKSTRVACALLVLGLLGFGGSEALASTMNEISDLSWSEIATFYEIESISDGPDGSELLEGIGIDQTQYGDLGNVANVMMSYLPTYPGLAGLLEVASASASLVAAILV